MTEGLPTAEAPKEPKFLIPIRYWIVSRKRVQLTLGSTLRLVLLPRVKRNAMLRSLYAVLERKEPFYTAYFLPFQRTVFYPFKTKEV